MWRVGEGDLELENCGIDICVCQESCVADWPLEDHPAPLAAGVFLPQSGSRSVLKVDREYQWDGCLLALLTLTTQVGPSWYPPLSIRTMGGLSEGRAVAEIPGSMWSLGSGKTGSKQKAMCCGGDRWVICLLCGGPHWVKGSKHRR